MMEAADPPPHARTAKICFDLSELPEDFGGVRYREDFRAAVAARADDPLSFIWLEGTKVCIGVGHSEIEMYTLDFGGKTGVTIGEVLKLAYYFKHTKNPKQDDIVADYGQEALRKGLKFNAHDARKSCEDFEFPDDIPDPTLPGEGVVQDASDTLANARGGSRGLVVGITHKDNKSREPFMDLLDLDACPGILFIEEIQSGAQDLLDYYLSDACAADKMPDDLVSVLTRLDKEYGNAQVGEDGLGNFSFLDMVAKAKAKGVSVVGLDAPECKVDQGDDAVYGARRCAAMNTYAMGIIQERLEANPDATFLLATGAAHVNTHMGGVPGFCQLLGVPGVTMENGGPPTAATEIEEFRTYYTDGEMRAIHDLSAKYPVAAAGDSLLDDDIRQRNVLTQVLADDELDDKVAEWEEFEFNRRLDAVDELGSKKRKFLRFLGKHKITKKIGMKVERKIEKKQRGKRRGKSTDNDNSAPPPADDDGLDTGF